MYWNQATHTVPLGREVTCILLLHLRPASSVQAALGAGEVGGSTGSDLRDMSQPGEKESRLNQPTGLQHQHNHLHH
jgi:hypothetical protein